MGGSWRIRILSRKLKSLLNLCWKEAFGRENTDENDYGQNLRVYTLSEWQGCAGGFVERDNGGDEGTHRCASRPFECE